MTCCSEEDLVRQFQATPNSVTFTAVCRAVLPQIQRHLLVLTRGHQADTEDLQQEVLVALYHQLERFRFQSSLKTFVWRITHHLAVNQWRQARRRREREHLAGREWSLRALPDPVEAVERQAQVGQVRAILHQLPEQVRSLLYLAEIEELSLQELAQVFQVPLGTIKSRLFRAKKQFAQRMTQEDDNDEASTATGSE